MRRPGTPRRVLVPVLATALGIAVLGAVLRWLPGSGVEVPLAEPAAGTPARTVPVSPDTARLAAELDERFRQGVVMLHARQYEPAATAFHRVLAIAPGLPEAHVNMGFAMLGLGQAAVARDFFESATELAPAQANAYYGLAEALEALGDLPGARGAMRTFIHLSDPDDPFVRKARAALWEWEAEGQGEVASPLAGPVAPGARPTRGGSAPGPVDDAGRGGGG